MLKIHSRYRTARYKFKYNFFRKKIYYDTIFSKVDAKSGILCA